MKITCKIYICTNCGYEDEIKTNHYGTCLHICKGCSWKPSQGNGYKIPSLGSKTYRVFAHADDYKAGEIEPLNLGGKSDD